MVGGPLGVPWHLIRPTEVCAQTNRQHFQPRFLNRLTWRGAAIILVFVVIVPYGN